MIFKKLPEIDVDKTDEHLYNISGKFEKARRCQKCLFARKINRQLPGETRDVRTGR